MPENSATHSYTAKVLSAVTMLSPGWQNALMTDEITSQEPFPTRKRSGDMPKRLPRASRRSYESPLGYTAAKSVGKEAMTRAAAGGGPRGFSLLFRRWSTGV